MRIKELISDEIDGKRAKLRNFIDKFKDVRTEEMATMKKELLATGFTEKQVNDVKEVDQERMNAAISRQQNDLDRIILRTAHMKQQKRQRRE